ncbi:amino acid ABC transporter substrate-binding protein, PAAT family [Caldanaerobius fijiensis DSM 17918]|uniref:Amino acid ABC transporter substrate-binding protein, PAAT family n=1 Tax=Caldanaerobius fijiensis DSM 17918 TaxID=1121256 RepID=A0A1M4X7Q0_9THEO|nr:amino acid ABC transporter substrate-binding protein [Caldanaerobius fijiensis]SHE89514.1 amino acid ABC transporter substrate-binding protein, PAAT family [Caldanaerobius fijiensis DSM 17918]
MNKRILRKIGLIITVFLLISAVLVGCTSNSSSSASKSSGVSDNSLQRVKQAGKLTIGIDDAFPPMEFRDDKNQLVGYDIDLAREAGKRLGVKVEWIPTDWNGVILALKSGKFDIIWSGMSITKERAKEVDFSPAYINESQVVVVKAENNTIKTQDDLKGKVVGTQLGSTGEEAAKKLKGLKDLKKYSKYTEAFLDLDAGRLDAIVVDELVGRYYMTKRPNQFKVVLSLNKEPFGIAYRKQDKELQKALNKVMAEMKKDGTMARISKKWFGEDISTWE